jgi:peptidoglycan/xylan/chitin deacetylase (PgdA/CDA1 family)
LSEEEEEETLEQPKDRNREGKRKLANGIILRSYPFHIPRGIQRIYPRRIWRVRTDSRKLYLSFDDGPNPGVTDRVLECLASSDARATFFCTGRNAERYPEWIEHLVAEGHGIGNHGYAHRSGKRCSDESYLKDVEQASKWVPSTLFRPPYGRLTRKQARALERRYRIVMWDVLSGDFDARLDGKESAEKVIRYSSPGSILLFHDSWKAEDRVLEALPRVLDHFHRKGYEFLPIPGSREMVESQVPLQVPQ